MARLRGAVSERDLPNTGIAVRIPTERLMHIDGTPREAFVPPVVVAPGPPGEDVVLERAIDLLVREPLRRHRHSSGPRMDVCTHTPPRRAFTALLLL